jgi:hypothetical protein
MLVVVSAKRIDIPLLTRTSATLLDVCTDKVFFRATAGRAVGRRSLATEVLPVIQPRTTPACRVRGSVDVSDLHLPPPFGLFLLRAELVILPKISVCLIRITSQPKLYSKHPGNQAKTDKDIDESSSSFRVGRRKLCVTLPLPLPSREEKQIVN